MAELKQPWLAGRMSGYTDGGGGWTEVAEYDFTTLANQDFESEANFTLNGVSFQTQHAGNPTQFAAVNGTGIIVDVQGGGVLRYGIVYCDLADLIPGLGLDTTWAIQTRYTGLSVDGSGNTEEIYTHLANAAYAYEVMCRTPSAGGTEVYQEINNVQYQPHANAKVAYLAEMREHLCRGVETVEIRVQETFASWPTPGTATLLNRFGREHRTAFSDPANYHYDLPSDKWRPLHVLITGGGTGAQATMVAMRVLELEG